MDWLLLALLGGLAVPGTTAVPGRVARPQRALSPSPTEPRLGSWRDLGSDAAVALGFSDGETAALVAEPSGMSDRYELFALQLAAPYARKRLGDIEGEPERMSCQALDRPDFRCMVLGAQPRRLWIISGKERSEPLAGVFPNLFSDTVELSAASWSEDGRFVAFAAEHEYGSRLVIVERPGHRQLTVRREGCRLEPTAWKEHQGRALVEVVVESLETGSRQAVWIDAATGIESDVRASPRPSSHVSPGGRYRARLRDDGVLRILDTKTNRVDTVDLSESDIIAGDRLVWLDARYLLLPDDPPAVVDIRDLRLIDPLGSSDEFEEMSPAGRWALGHHVDSGRLVIAPMLDGTSPK